MRVLILFVYDTSNNIRPCARHFIPGQWHPIQDRVNSSLVCLYKWPHQREDNSRTREKVIGTKP